MWRVALGLSPEAAGPNSEHEVTEGLFALRSEILSLEALLSKRGVPEGLWLDHLNRIKEMTMAASLNRHREQLNDAFRNDARVMLQWAAFYLGELDQGELTDHARDELASRVEELEEALKAHDVPDAFYEFASGLLQQLKSALALAPIQGLAPLRAAVRKASADLHYDKDVIEAAVQAGEANPASETLRQKAGAALASAAKVTGEVDKLVSSYTSLVGKAYGFGQALVDYCQRN